MLRVLILSCLAAGLVAAGRRHPLTPAAWRINDSMRW